MTISAKLSDVLGLEFVVSDPPDTDDVGGFSDPIQTVGAKTAKFSGGSTMKANTGLIIGLSQVKINTTGAIPGIRTEVPADFIGWVADGSTVDNNETTFTSTTNSAAEAVVDYGSVATRDIKLVTRLTANRVEFGSGNLSLDFEISDDGIVFTIPVTTPTQFQFLNVPATGDMGGTIPVDTGIVTFNDPNSQTFRFVKIKAAVAVGGSAKNWFIYQFTEQDIGPNQVTVRLRSSATQDVADGTVLISDQVMNESSQLTFSTQLLLTGIGQFVTVEIVSLTSFDIPVTLSDITSVKEV